MMLHPCIVNKQPQSFIRLIVFVLLVCATGCRLEPDEIAPLYNHYQFDAKIINKLPVYDSLVSAILEQSSYFQQHIDEKASYRSFRYRPFSTDSDTFNKLPEEISPKINRYYNELGKGFIYGFDVFKDSTVKICIRRNYADSFRVEMLENLSYFPGGSINRRSFPDKDTLLTKHWQYWVQFFRPRLF